MKKKQSPKVVTPETSQILTVPRCYADGVAHLKGKSNSERAKSLIQIAHPNFRSTLCKQAEQLGLF